MNLAPAPRTIARPRASHFALITLTLAACVGAESAADPLPATVTSVSGAATAASTASDPSAPRLVFPLAGARATSRRPELRFRLAPGTDGARVDLCADAACTHTLETLDVHGGTATPTTDLPQGVVFWRARGLRGTTAGTNPGPAWLLQIPARSAARAGVAGYGCDVDADGTPDAVAGAEDPGAESERAYVHLGGRSLRGVPAPVVLAAPDGAGGTGGFGELTACAGDLNGDGRADLVVGAPGADGDAGRAYVYLARAGGDVVSRAPSVELRAGSGAGSAGARFGFTAAGAGDVNGDGYGDLLVGAYNADGGAGRVYLYLGGPDGPAAEPTAVINAPDAGGQFGIALTGVGDMNGDGLDDFAVGADQWSDRRGRVYVFLGGDAAARPALVLEGATPGGSFGVSVAAAGDVNGDGLSDLIVGAQGMRAGRGGAYVYSGGAGSLSPVPAAVLAPDGAERAFGVTVSSAGDVNGDGLSDVQVASAAGAAGPAVYYGAARGVRSAR